MSTISTLKKQRRLLLIANEFLPGSGGSLQRILAIYRTFISAGWAVDVLTSQQNLPADQRTSAGRDAATENSLTLNLCSNPGGNIYYAYSIDASKVFAIKGRYPGCLAAPDKFALSWVPAALNLGREIIKKNKPDLIFSSSPTLSPHLVSDILSKHSGAKWIADYRDPTPYMHNRPMPGYLNWMHRRIDQRTLTKADGITFATHESQSLYIEKYPQLAKKALKVIPNGYSAVDMEKAKLQYEAEKTNYLRADNGLIIYYSGELYPNGRDPVPVFRALASYLNNSPAVPVTILFQGAGDGAAFSSLLADLNIQDHVKFLPRVSYEESLNAMLKADVLLLIQDELFHNQVPGKLYEYIATGRTILLKTNPDSATLKQALPFAGILAGYNESELIQTLVYLGKQKAESLPMTFVRDTAHLSREVQTESLVIFANSLS